MGRLLFPQAVGPVTRLLLRLIGGHSWVLGLGMLIAPDALLRPLGFSPPMSGFFPSQSGLFLLILGTCYLLAAVRPALVSVVVLSKASAVVFLVTHAGFLGAPPIIWVAAAVDGAMLATVVGALRLEPVTARPAGTA